MEKFDRKYRLTVQAPIAGNVEIELPFTVEFDIHRDYLSSANSFNLRLYNLSQTTRSKIHKDPNDLNLRKLITLKAGYGSQLSTIAHGNITEAFSVREGVNMITSIQGHDWWDSASNDFFSGTFPKRSPVDNVIRGMVDSLEKAGIASGAIRRYRDDSGAPILLQKGKSYSGSATSYLRDLTGKAFFIDNGKAFVLEENEYFSGGLKVVNAASGLLGVPAIYQHYIVFDILLEPQLQIGQKIRLDSKIRNNFGTPKIFTNDGIDPTNFSGDYKVAFLKHRGTISETVSGNAVTTVGFLRSKVLREVF